MIGKEYKTVDFSGQTWVEIKEFTGDGFLREFWCSLPTMSGTNAEIALFDKDNLTDSEERYNSGNLTGGVITDKAAINRCITDGDILKIKSDNANDDGSVDVIIYWTESVEGGY